MKTTRRTLVVLGFILMATPALGFTVRTTEDGSIIRWRQPVVHLTLDSSLEELGDLEEVEAAVVEMVEVWTEQAEVPIKFKFRYADCGRLGYNSHDRNENCVATSDSVELWKSMTEFNPGATTILSFDPDDGTIQDADIVFNTADWRWSLNRGERGKLNARTVFIHEFGHFVGLAHSEYDSSVMYPTTYLGASFDERLHNDDIAAIDSAYHGFDDEIMDIYAPKNCTSSVLGSSASTDFSAIPPFILFSVVLLMLRRRSRLHQQPVRIQIHRRHKN